MAFRKTLVYKMLEDLFSMKTNVKQKKKQVFIPEVLLHLRTPFDFRKIDIRLSKWDVVPHKN